MVDQLIRVLIVGDSPIFRELMRDSIQQCAGIKVVGETRDGAEALTQATRLHPDVIVLDVPMPKFDGQRMLEVALAVGPIPVLMIGSVTAPAAESSLRALETGTLDYIARPTANLEAFRAELLQKLKALARVDVPRMLEIRRKQLERLPKAVAAVSQFELRATSCCIAIGISTGGPPVLTELFSALSPPMPPILVVQHMPGAFTGPFAKRLDGISDLDVREATNGAEVLPNMALIAPGGRHLRLRRNGTRVVARVTDHDPVNGHRPSIDVMMTDASAIYGANCLGLIMTGMGLDGVAGCRAIRECGGEVWGQDQATSAVYGMNKAAFTAGWVTQQFAVQDLPHLLRERAVPLLKAPCCNTQESTGSFVRQAHSPE